MNHPIPIDYVDAENQLWPDSILTGAPLPQKVRVQRFLTGREKGLWVTIILLLLTATLHATLLGLHPCTTGLLGKKTLDGVHGALLASGFLLALVFLWSGTETKSVKRARVGEDVLELDGNALDKAAVSTLLNVEKNNAKLDIEVERLLQQYEEGRI